MMLARWWSHGMRGSMREDAKEYGAGKDQYQSLHSRVSRLFVFSTRKSASAQEQSNLFTMLSLDIRLLIYQQLFKALGFHGDLHIVRSCVVLHGLRCFKCGPRTDENDPDSWPAHKLHDSGRHWKSPEEYMDGILSLLKVCQRVNSEASAVLYSGITFHLEHVSTASRFMILVPALSLSNITSLVISIHLHEPLYHSYFNPSRGNGSPAFRPGDFRRYRGKYADVEEGQWLLVCKVLARLQKLSKLRIIVREKGFIASENKLLKPLMAVHVQDFVVQLPWSLSEARDALDETGQNVPFKLRRSTGAQRALFSPDYDDAVPGGAVRRFVDLWHDRLFS